jgi:hypothetical protein
LRTFELRQELETMRSLSFLRKLPTWLPMRNALVRRHTRRVLLRAEAERDGGAAQQVSTFARSAPAEVVYVDTGLPVDVDRVARKTGTDNA